MYGQVCENGIYQSRSSWGPKAFNVLRNVYVQNGFVRLVKDDAEWVFRYNDFFKVNDLGDRVADIPEGLNVGAI